MHKRISCKRVKQMMADIGINDNKHDDEQQLLLEQKEQSVSEDKQLIKLDSENK